MAPGNPDEFEAAAAKKLGEEQEAAEKEELAKAAGKLKGES